MYLTRPLREFSHPPLTFPFLRPIEKARPSAAETGPAGVLFFVILPFYRQEKIMSNILLFFMSAYKPDIKNGAYSRAQTNETVLYELQKQKERRPDTVLALCSASVRNVASVPAPDGGASVTTLDYFRQQVLPAAGIPADSFVSIPVPDSMNEGAQAKAIQDIVQKVQPGDTLYIDLSGGMRDTAMLLVAVARYLRDIRDVTAHVLYTELVEGKPLLVRDSDKLYDLFDLISATDEFFATGRTGRLSGYLRVSAVSSPKTATLLNSIEKFSEDLLLCNAARLLDDISALKAALTDVLKDTNVTRNKLDTLLYDLLNEGFKKEFRNLDKKKARALPTLVRWCLNHDMFQQAFTLLSEQTPAFVCSHIFVQPTQKGVDFLASQLQNQGKNWSYPLFHFHFCRTALMAAEIKKNNKPGLIFDSDLRLDRTASNADDTTFFRIATDDELNRYLDRSVQEGLLLLDESQRGRLIETILGYQKVQQYRNQINHASDTVGLLPLTVRDVRATLEEICTALDAITDLKPNSNGVHRLSLTERLSYVPAQ